MNQVKTQSYAVKITYQAETDRGVEWHGDIKHHDQIIGTCENQGNGGQTMIHIPDTTHRNVYQHAAKIACPESCEAPSRFAELLADVSDGQAQGI